VGVELVDDREGGGEAVQPRRVGGEHAQVAGEHVRLVGVLAVAKLQVADDDVLVLECACEHRGGFVQDPRLLAARSGGVHCRVLDRD
jgi:hypothetical protein